MEALIQVWMFRDGKSCWIPLHLHLEQPSKPHRMLYRILSLQQSWFNTNKMHTENVVKIVKEKYEKDDKKT